jgi:hypothetical protein
MLRRDPLANAQPLIRRRLPDGDDPEAEDMTRTGDVFDRALRSASRREPPLARG